MSPAIQSGTYPAGHLRYNSTLALLKWQLDVPKHNTGEKTIFN